MQLLVCKRQCTSLWQSLHLTLILIEGFLPDQFVPVNSSWGPNNRSVAFRIPVSDEESTRIEHRVAGAEANAYLVLSSILSGIMFGIKNKLTPDKPRIDNACDNPDKDMPLNINDALVRLENPKY